MPFGYVSPEQAMRDKADYARRGIARGRSCVTLQYAGGILMVAPNASSALHKISEIYDRIAFAAVGRYTEYETLRKAGVTYADLTGYRYDRSDVTARSIANYYAQNLDQIFTQSLKPYEVELVVAEVGPRPDSDQIYRITFDGSVSDEPGFVAFGGQADQVATVLKDRFSDGMSLTEALGAALAALAAPPAGSSGSSASAANATNGNAELTADQLEVAILDRARAHRTFRRLHGARLEELLAESRGTSAAEPDSGPSGSSASDGDPGTGSGAGSGSGGEPPTGPSGTGGDGTPRGK
ncbi:MAG TPA: proteasome subunit alpha [Trebonia sp.]|jgi:proteasome alpha subunit|nr:proteasome subunit alpha [Trebonia sp.]